MSRSKPFGKVSETNQSPRNGPFRAAPDICDSLATEQQSDLRTRCSSAAASSSFASGSCGAYAEGMSREVWGTCAVKDHLAHDAFIRQVLLFDRLAVPYPRDEQERNRWQRPNPADTAETWDPDQLDELLKLLGTQDRAPKKRPEPRVDLAVG
jgi:hypothetical protein